MFIKSYQMAPSVFDFDTVSIPLAPQEVVVVPSAVSHDQNEKKRKAVDLYLQRSLPYESGTGIKFAYGRTLAPDLAVTFDQGSHVKRGDRKVRYDAYKKARTLQECFALGARKDDLVLDIERGFVTLGVAAAAAATATEEDPPIQITCI